MCPFSPMSITHTSMGASSTRAYAGDIRRQAAFAVYIHRYLQIACLRRKTLIQVFAEAGSVAFGQIDVNYSICSSKCESQ